MICYVPLTKGLKAAVDAADFERIKALGVKWCVNDGYAFNALLGRMHRWLLGADEAVMVDHRDGNRLNNVRSNLRLASNSQNQANRRCVRGASKFKGVCLQKRPSSKNVWVARIVVEGKQIYLGSFDEEIAAARAYDAAATKHFGEFALTNLALSI